MAKCDKFLADHVDDGSECSDSDHSKALRARRCGAPAWSPLVRGSDPGGRRDYLDGKPVHCGTGLDLQRFEVHDDDYGSFSLRIEGGVPVRYEVDARGDVVLYASVGGYSFTSRLEPHMRFRWRA